MFNVKVFEDDDDFEDFVNSKYITKDRIQQIAITEKQIILMWWS